MSQLPSAGDEIRVDMGFGDMRNPHPLGLSGPKVGIRIAIGVDYQGFATARAPNEIAGLRELGIVEASEKHDESIYLCNTPAPGRAPQPIPAQQAWKLQTRHLRLRPGLCEHRTGERPLHDYLTLSPHR
jgi:hypothetical protein